MQTVWKEVGRQGNWLFLSDIQGFQGLFPHKTTTLPNAEQTHVYFHLCMCCTLTEREETMQCAPYPPGKEAKSLPVTHLKEKQLVQVRCPLYSEAKTPPSKPSQ